LLSLIYESSESGLEDLEELLHISSADSSRVTSYLTLYFSKIFGESSLFLTKLGFEEEPIGSRSVFYISVLLTFAD